MGARKKFRWPILNRIFTVRPQLLHRSRLDASGTATYAVNFMPCGGWTGTIAALGLLACTSLFAADDVTLLRVFLKDGTSLVSYGELARVDNRVVFSMPTSASSALPQLHLINIDAAHVDWERTTRYAESARADRYLATRAESDYALLTGEVAQALNDVSLATDPSERLAIVEKARKTLADWPGSHFNYKQNDVREMLGMLDEAIADLRAAAGVDRFDLSFITPERPRTFEPLLPPPTPKEAIEQVLAAARLSSVPAERVSLLTVALGSLERDAAVLPSDWVASVRSSAMTEIQIEAETDRAYQAMTTRVVRTASERARAADVRGIQSLFTEVLNRDAALGSRRPDSVASLLAAVEAELDAARRLRLARDRWELRLPQLRRYHAAITMTIADLDRVKAQLEDIKALAGPAPAMLSSIQRAAGQVMKASTLIVPPEEMQGAHALVQSAAQLADSAAQVRREAVLTGDFARAWDASSAAAGALMLIDRARADMQATLQQPQLAR